MTFYLPENTILNFEKENKQYKIKKVVGVGSSTITYLASTVNSFGQHSEEILKEYYPSNLNITRNTNGCLEYPLNEKEKFEEYKNNFYDCLNFQHNLRLDKNFKNSIPPVLNIFKANNTIYGNIILYEGVTLNQLSGINISDKINICLSTAKLVHTFHKKGYLCLDIKPENLFIPKIYNNEYITDLVYYIDFDSIKKQNEITLEQTLSYTPSWAAPEQINPYDFENISEKTDVYALGELVFWSIFNQHSTINEHHIFSEYPFDTSDSYFQYTNRLSLAHKFSKLFQNTIRSSSKNRFSSMQPVIDILENIVKELKKEEFVISTLPAVSPYFLGRKKELNQINLMLKENNNLYIYGIGGIGKSTLLRNFCKLNKNNYDDIIYIQCSNDFKSSFIDDNQLCINTIEKNIDESVDDYFNRKLRALKNITYNHSVLFIIDNYEFEITKTITNNIMANGWKVIISSRKEPVQGTFNKLKITDIQDNKELYKLFEHNINYKISNNEFIYVDNIIEKSYRNTFVIELVAKLTANNQYTIKKSSDFLNERSPSRFSSESISYIKDGEELTKSIDKIIQNLFYFDTLKPNEENFLKIISLFGVSGININDLEHLLTDSFYTLCIKLKQKGWINFENNIISLHPLLADTLLSRPSDTSESYCKTIEKLIHNLYVPLYSEWHKQKYQAKKEIFIKSTQENSYLLLVSFLSMLSYETIPSSVISQIIKINPLFLIPSTVAYFYLTNPKSQEIILKYADKYLNQKNKSIEDKELNKILLNNYDSPVNYDLINKYTEIASELINHLQNINRFKMNKKFNDFNNFNNLLFIVVNTLPIYKHADILKKSGYLLDRYISQKNDEVPELFNLRIHVFSYLCKNSKEKNIHLKNIKDELFRFELYCNKHNNLYYEALYFSSLAIYYETKAKFSNKTDRKINIEKAIEYLDKADKKILSSKKAYSKLNHADFILRKFNLYIRNQNINKALMENLLIEAEDIITSQTHEYSTLRANMYITKAYFFTYIDKNSKNAKIYLNKALNLSKSAYISKLSYIDKIIIPAASIYAELNEFDFAESTIFLGLEECNLNCKIEDFVTQKKKLKNNLKKIRHSKLLNS